LDKKLLAKIWLVMSALFGTKWSNPYGEWNEENKTIPIWGAALRGLTSEQVEFGLNEISNSGSTYVPTAPEFKEYCIGPKEHCEHKRMRLTEEQNKTNLLERKDKALTRAEGKIAFEAMSQKLKL